MVKGSTYLISMNYNSELIEITNTKWRPRYSLECQVSYDNRKLRVGSKTRTQSQFTQNKKSQKSQPSTSQSHPLYGDRDLDNGPRLDRN